MKSFLRASLILGQFSLGIFCGASSNAYTIHNVHELQSSPARIMRGPQPAKKVNELAEDGITDVLIFKEELKHEVTDEIAGLVALGVKNANIHHIAMPWNKIKDQPAACKKAVLALQTVQKIAQKKGHSLYFHCTYGEDRTGMLAGLFRMAEQRWTMKKAYADEMCKNGFADGSSTKPGFVAVDVRKNLLPIFKHIAAAIERGDPITESLCDTPDAAAQAIDLPTCKKL